MRLYVYLRIGKVTGRPPDWALYVTNLVGAFWHGLYIGMHSIFQLLNFQDTMHPMQPFLSIWTSLEELENIFEANL